MPFFMKLQTYGANGYTGAAASQAPASTYAAPSAAVTAYGSQQTAAGYGTQQQQAATSSYPTSYSAAAQVC
jgi:hypothetical protein